MTVSRKFVALLLLVVIAGVAYLIVSHLTDILHQYQQAREFSPWWGYVYLGTLLLAAGAALALVIWIVWFLVSASAQKHARRQAHSRAASQMTRSEQTAETELHLRDVERLADDATLPSEVRESLGSSLVELRNRREGQRLEIVAFGTISSGKSSVLNALAGRDVFRSDAAGGTTLARSDIAWPGADKVVLVDTPGLAEVKGLDRELTARDVARDADLVLFVVDGPIKSFERELLGQLTQMEKRVLVCLNKQDWYSSEDRSRLVEQLAEQTSGLIDSRDVVALRARPIARPRVRVMADGQQVEESVDQEPDIQALADRMLEVIAHDGRDLLAANLLLQARGLASEAKRRIQSTLDKQADEIINRSMWQAGAAAALAPVPVLDVAASLAISSNMVLSLARVYRQSIDLETASRLIGELGKNLVAILGTIAAAPAVGTAIASILKTAPGVGTLAGGALQGLVQALVTRWIGRVFRDYFRGEMQEPALGLTALARQKWNEVTQPAELAALVKTGLAQFGKRRT